MIDESSLDISELMNFGINYGECIPVNIHEMSLLFDNKKDKITYYKVIEKIGQDLIDNYAIPKKAVSEFVRYGKVFSYESDDNKKCFYIDYHKLMQHVLLYFMSYTNDTMLETVDILSNCNIEEAAAATIKKLKEIRKELDSITSSIELESFVDKHQGVSRDVLFKLGLIKSVDDNKVSSRFDEYTDLIKEDIRVTITRVIVNNKYLLKELILNSSINEEIFENINKEKFVFYLAAATLNKAAQFETIDPCVYFPINYYMHKTEIGRPNINISLGRDSYNFLNFEKSLMDYISKHPKVGMPKFRENTFNDCTPIETRDYLLELSKDTLENFDIIETNDLYIPSSENTGIKRTNTGNKTKKTKTNEISKLSLQKRKFYSDNEDKIYVTLMGKNKFEGYLAHVFDNGIVIFEKYDKNNQNLSNESGAAYIMTINNFNEFSKKSISELREYVNTNPNGDISYKCHAGKWMSAIKEIIDMPTDITTSQIDRVLIKYKYKVNTK